MSRFFAPALCACCLLLLACDDPSNSNSETHKRAEIAGYYRFALTLNPEELPFTGDLQYVDDVWTLTIYNGEEEIEVNNIRITEDSVIAPMPVFQSELRGRIESADLITGSYINYGRSETTSIPFIAEKGKDYRFTSSKSTTILPKQYHAQFVSPDSSITESILILSNDQGRLNGSFLTETGDYRYLDGNIMNERVYLSTFDGAHAYYFEAEIKGDSLVNGVFRSGISSKNRWCAVADTTFVLSKPDELTFLKEGYGVIDFNLPNQDGDTVTWNDLQLQNKIVILDIMGSWCPNCMDATRALKTLSAPYTDAELRVIPVAFELTDDFLVAKKRIDKMHNDLGIQNEFLFGGYASKANATATFPMLNHIMSFPTIIVIDQNRKIQLIYTGFYGPGTGRYHNEFMEQMASLLSDLVNAPN